MKKRREKEKKRKKEHRTGCLDISLFALSNAFLLQDYWVFKGLTFLNAFRFSVGGTVYPRLHEVGRKLEKAEEAVHWKERKRGN